MVENLVLYHHKPKNSNYLEFAQVIQKADHHSSKEHIKSDETWEVLLTPLTSLFSRISLDNKKSEEYYVPVNELDFAKAPHP